MPDSHQSTPEALARVPAVFSEQPMLFDDWPEQPALVDQARELLRKEKEYVHSGKIILKDHERCLAVIRAVLSEVPIRAICRHFKIGFESVKQIAVEMEASGKLRTLKERMADDWAEITMMAQWRLKEKLMNNEVPANVLSILGGIGTEKYQLLTGAATAVVELKRDDVSGDDVLADLEKMKRVRAVPPAQIPQVIEGESVVMPKKANETA